MMSNKELNNLFIDFMSVVNNKPKTKKLKPLIKQITYKGITKKWTFNGAELNIVNGGRYDWLILSKDYETIEDFIKSIIDEEIRGL